MAYTSHQQSLSKETKDQIQSLYRELIKSLDLRPRYGQRLMIAEVAKTLGGIIADENGDRVNHTGVAVVEAGTGTGKTLAYLVSALPLALKHEKKLIVSTATIALQEQILMKDLPLFQKNSSLKFNYALAKGRGRYLCVVKLDKALQQLSGIVSTLDLFDSTPEAADKDLYESLLMDYAKGEWDGDKDQLDFEIEPDQWRLITATHRECSNRRCPQFENCAFFKARAILDSADVVVANHDLVLSDLVLGGGAILPAPEKAIYVFDEGHHLADKALSHFRMELGIRSQRQWLKQLDAALTQLISETGIPVSIMHSLREAPQHIEAIQQGLTFIWPMAQEILAENERVRFEFGRLPEEFRQLFIAIKPPAQKLVAGLEKLNDMLQASLDDKGEGEFNQETAENWQAPIGILLARAEQFWDAILLFSTTEKNNEKETSESTDTEVDQVQSEPQYQPPPTARWLNKLSFDEDWDIQVCVSPINVSDQLASTLWFRCFGAVVTSATLTALNSFVSLARETGLPNYSNYLQVQSPFNYPEIGQLQVANLQNDPRSEHYQEEINQWLLDHTDLTEGTLVLFSSRAQMTATRDALLDKWYDELLTQGFLPKAEIVKRHKKKIDEGKGGVIFGLASFAEGIDLPGDYLTHVVIVKVPFAVPDDPIQAATSEWIETQGRNPFMELTLPAASVRLVQAAGRLIRKEDDRGKISILDKRLITQRYGKLLLDALPPFRRI